MVSAPSPPRFVPTLTEVVRLPARDQVEPVNPEWVVEQVLQRLAPQFEALVRQTVADVLSEHESASGQKQVQN